MVVGATRDPCWRADVRRHLRHHADCRGVGGQRRRLGHCARLHDAVTALSLPSIIMLKRVVKLPLLILFLSVVVIGILGIGFLFNAITDWFI